MRFTYKNPVLQRESGRKIVVLEVSSIPFINGSLPGKNGKPVLYKAYCGTVKLKAALYNDAGFVKDALSYEGEKLLFDIDASGQVWLVDKSFREMELRSQLKYLQLEAAVLENTIERLLRN